MASGDILIKKLLVWSFLFCLILTLFTVNAEETAKATIEPYGEFYTLENDRDKVAQILGITENDLNNIQDIYLAVNKENTKQIRIRTEITDFSNSIGNISNLSDDKITALIPDISGFRNVKGDVINKDGQKFIRVQLRSSDSGGEYILTQYITVASKQNFVLSFYTDINEDTEYIENTFESFSSSYFKSDTRDNKKDTISYILLGAAILFLLVCVVVITTIIIDLRKKEETE